MVIRLSFVLMSLSGLVQASNLPDPTRPPVSVNTAVQIELPSGPTLQLIRTLEGKRIAIISGQTVKVGTKFGDAKVMRIDEDRVVLRGPDGVQTLKLFPDVEKRPVAVGRAESKPPLKMHDERAKRKELK
jgi:MSHA biogenesis protein MshK